LGAEEEEMEAERGGDDLGVALHEAKTTDGVFLASYAHHILSTPHAKSFY
jgi:hypothetical protein